MIPACCERCSTPDPAKASLRGRWFCPPCWVATRNQLLSNESYTLGILRQKGLIT